MHTILWLQLASALAKDLSDLYFVLSFQTFAKQNEQVSSTTLSQTRYRLSTVRINVSFGTEIEGE